MTEHHEAVIVCLKPGIQIDNVVEIMDAIRLLRGVIGVQRHTFESEKWLATVACKGSEPYYAMLSYDDWK